MSDEEFGARTRTHAHAHTHTHAHARTPQQVLLFAHDADEFNRWEAGQRLMRALLLKLYDAAGDACEACVCVCVVCVRRVRARVCMCVN